MAQEEGSPRAIIAAFFANVGIAVSKFVAFIATGSASMLAEAIHSLADTSNQGLLLLGRKRARRPADARHPFGYGRNRYFWPFVVALVLFSVGGLFAIFDGIEKLRTPQSVDSPIWAIVVLTIAVGLESFSLRTALHESRDARGNSSLLGFIRRTKDAEISAVLLEDTGALIGLVFAFIGVMMAWITDDSRWDALGSLAIGILLVMIAALLAYETSSLLLGESISPEDEAEIRTAILGAATVQRIIHLRAIHISPDTVLLATKLEFDHDLTFEHLARCIDDVEAHVRSAYPKAELIFIEPDYYRGDADGAARAVTSVESPE